MGGVPALSRPPSRVGAPIDLSAEHAIASSSNVKSLKEQEDADPGFQRMVAESIQHNNSGQENGVTQGNAHFGPAKSDYNYDSGQWAMTAYASSREVIDHPPPSKRRRVDGTPAFLRGSKETGYLAPLLTIYHNIPLAREALLMPTLNVHAYAHDSSWWSGTTDENNKAISSDNTTQIDQNQRNLLTEVQCLMAFLDKTTRAYGSVDALADLQAVRSRGAGTSFHKFLDAWAETALRQAPHEQLTQVFSSVATKARGLNDNPGEDRTFQCVEPWLNHTPDETLTDLLDMTIWDDNNAGGLGHDVWIGHCGEIFTVKISEPMATTRPTGLNIDPVWYADRYMFDCREETMQIRRQVQNIRRQIEQLTHLQRRCQIFNVNNRTLDINEVLNAAAKASTVAATKTASSSGFLDAQQSSSENRVTQADVDELGSELQKVLEQIRQRLTLLDQRKEELRQKSRQIAMQLTKPTAERPDVPHRRYTLQGVATTPGTTFFRRLNPDPDLLEPEQGSEADGLGYQWWRSSWKHEEAHVAAHPPMVGPLTRAQAESGSSGVDSSMPWSLDRVTEKEVLEAIKNTSSQVLLVYADESALAVQSSPLSASLQRFVDRDNHSFADELLLEEGRQPGSSGDHEVETEFEDVPLIDPTRSSSSARDLTPMSTSSPGHDEDATSHVKSGKEDDSDPVAGRPPSYEDSVGRLEMQEKKENKIGMAAERLLQRYGDESSKGVGVKDNSGDLLDLEDS
jgi:hypothetical protein